MKKLTLILFLFCCSIFSIAQIPNYLIICSDSLTNCAVQLKDYRETSGNTVDIQKLSTIVSDQPIETEVIDAWIENYILHNDSLKYIVLLGNTDLIPTYSSTYDGLNFDSDLWYAVQNDSLNPNYLPKVYLGRIPVRDSQDFSNYFEKIKHFECKIRNQNTILFYGNEAEMSYYAINRDVKIAQDLGFKTVSLVDPTEAELFEAVNNLPLFAVLYYGHGSLLGNVPLSVSNLSRWNNTSNPVLFFSGGCDFNNNVYNQSRTILPLGDRLLLGSNGSVISIGASINGGYGADYDFIEGILKNLKKYLTIGELYNYALAYQYEVWPDNGIGSWTYYFIRRMNIIGDPGLIINSFKYQSDTLDLDSVLCDGDSFEIGDQYFTETGIYSVNLEDSYGCDSIVTINLAFHELPNPEITFNSDTLTSTETFSSYQWYNEDGLIEGAISYQYIIDKSGTYYLEVTNENECLAISDDVSLIKVGINDLALEQLKLVVIPNPNDGKFRLRFENGKQGKCQVQIINELGQIQLEKESNITSNILEEEFDLSHLSKGNYFIKVFDGEITNTEKIILK